MPAQVDNIASLSRKELQALVKQHGCCKGNAKTEVMIASLTEFFAAQEPTEEPETIMQDEPAAIEQDEPAAIEQDEPETIEQDEPEAIEQVEPETVEQDEPEAIEQDEPEAIEQVEPETVEQDEPEAIGHTSESLASLSRKELQALAKVHGCKANGKTAEIVESLARVLDPAAARNPVSDAESDDEQEEEEQNDVQRIIAEEEETDEIAEIAEIAVEEEATEAVTMLTASVRVEQDDDEADEEETADDSDMIEAIESLALVDEESIFTAAIDYNGGDDEKLQQFVTSHPHLQFTAFGKVRCSLTRHEMPADLGEVCSHLDGPKYMRMAEDFTEFEPAVVAHPTLREKLYCPLTETTLNRIRRDVINHIQGKKYAEMSEEGNENSTGNTMKLKGVATPKGKKTVFAEEGDAKTPKYKTTHWNMEDYAVAGQSAC